MEAPSTRSTRPHAKHQEHRHALRDGGALRRVATELTPHAIEQIAQRVAQLLHDRPHSPPEPAQLLDASQLARHLGVTRTWVYEHALQLGAIRLGTGSKARMRFDLDTATAALQRLQKKPLSTPAATESSRRGRPRRRQQATIELLPVHEPRARGILARITRRR